MIKRNADMQKEVREKMREGTGTVEILHVFRKEELRGKTRLFARLRIPAGSSIGYHEHHEEEEVFFIIAGRGTVNDNGVKTRWVPAMPFSPAGAWVMPSRTPAASLSS